jgi:hypothetical protein
MRSLIYITLILCLAACGKTTQVEGTVYSKHNIPVPNAKIVLHIYTTASSYPTSTQNKPETDGAGHYSFEFKANKLNKKYRYKIVCYSDSGNSYEKYIDKGVVNEIDFKLE